MEEGITPSVWRSEWDTAAFRRGSYDRLSLLLSLMCEVEEIPRGGGDPNAWAPLMTYDNGMPEPVLDEAGKLVVVNRYEQPGESHEPPRGVLPNGSLVRSNPKFRLEWFKLLGRNWSGFDNVWCYRAELHRWLSTASRSELSAMMDRAEKRFFRSANSVLLAYRGAEYRDRGGFSYSLSPDVARKFPFLDRYRAKDPALITVTIPKSAAVFKFGRGEEEVIAMPERVRVIKVERIATPASA